MTDLTDLDRRAAVAMGLELVYENWTGLVLDEMGHEGQFSTRFWSPTRDANDCREFERFAIGKGLFVTLQHAGHYAQAEAIDLSMFPSVPYTGFQLAISCPTYDLVARVLALLDALEKES
jgi:hypothetical protein